MRLSCCFLCLILLNGVAARIDAAEASPAALADFDQNLKPFLAQYCDRCHNDKKQEGEFRLDTLARDFGGHSAKHWAEIIVPPPQQQSRVPQRRVPGDEAKRRTRTV